MILLAVAQTHSWAGGLKGVTGLFQQFVEKASRAIDG